MTVSIIEALDDPALFKTHFRGDTWQPWQAFLQALFALPMDEDALALYQHDIGRSEPPMAAFKESALIIGRRGGKSRCLALTAVFLATFRSYEQFLAPGEVATIAVIAADRKQGSRSSGLRLGCWRPSRCWRASSRKRRRRRSSLKQGRVPPTFLPMHTARPKWLPKVTGPTPEIKSSETCFVKMTPC